MITGSFLFLLATDSLFFGGNLSNGLYDFLLSNKPFFSAPTNENEQALSCVNISRLLTDFNNFSGSLDKAIHIDTSTNDWKGFVDFWLYGTATEINWFDKYCQEGWKYIIDLYSVTPVIDNSNNGSVGILNNGSVGILNNGSVDELAVIDNKKNYLVLGLCCLFIFANFYYNVGFIKDVLSTADRRLYDLLCMFDYPGFMVNKSSVMPLAPNVDLWVEHNWLFSTDPGDGRSCLCHVATYTIDFEFHAFCFASLPPAWSVPSYVFMFTRPGVEWPLNYDYFSNLTLFNVPFM